MRQFAPIDIAHAAVGLIVVGMSTGVRDIGKPVGEFDKRRIRSCTDALVVVFSSALSTCASFIVSECVYDFSSHIGLCFAHETASNGCHLAVGEACILYAVVIISSEENRQHMVLALAHKVTIGPDSISDHVEMEAIGMTAAIGLINAVVEGVGRSTDVGNDVGIAVKGLAEIGLTHG